MAKKKAKKSVSPAKSSSSRSINSPRGKATTKKKGMPSAPFAEQDSKRRLGNFVGRGEAPRKQP